jgi:hypothetical protein
MNMAKQLEPTRRVVRDAVSLPGTQWLKGAGSQKPTKIQMTRFKPVARAWTELFVKSIEACSNSSEIQLDVALAAKMIIEKADFDLGNTLSASLEKIIENPLNIFSLGHCNLITELCRAKKVPWYDDDLKLYPIRALNVQQFEKFGKVENPRHEEEEDEELREIDQYESGVHPNQQQPEMQPHLHTEDDIAALMTQLAIVEACHVPHTYYSPTSSLYQAAVAQRAAFQPGPMYPTYATSELLDAQHDYEMAQIAARHRQKSERWRNEYEVSHLEEFFDETEFGLDGQRGEGGSPHQQ